MSARKKISQVEARALRRRVAELERRDEIRNGRFSSEYPGGVNLGSVSWANDAHLSSAVYTAQMLGHAIVAKATGKHAFNLFAVKP
ncbi:MAG: hypothetical protein E6Q97_09450 [Desulfurellales bacterium]|nr:MAG: hypothetical protein E6Q97_09450 [Desulfurellales bacterium]